MLEFISSKSIKPENNTCYCFNRDCNRPENNLDAHVCVSCGTKLLLQNRYRGLQIIGRGGFGRTFKGIDMSQASKPDVAIKQFWIQANSRNKAKAAQLFEQEALHLKLLGEHAHIPALYDYFIESEPYLIQEFISGDRLSTEKAWDEEEIRELLVHILPLIQFIHSHQVIHRDIKPANIVRRQSDRSLTLVDFGAAKVVRRNQACTIIIGSAAYTAPEQLHGQAVFASDIYSLGVTCIHLLTGTHSFELFDSHNNTWRWRDRLSQPVNKQLGNILDRMLAIDINERYQYVWEVIKDLQPQPVRIMRSAMKITGIGIAASLVLISLPFAYSFIQPLIETSSNKNSTPTPTPNVQSQTPQPTPTTTTIPPADSPAAGLYSYSQNKQVSFPLENTSVDAKIAGNLSRVEVKQTFSNPSDKPLEAIYQLPLPDDAAVDEMEIRIGDRLIRGIIKRKQEAKTIYQQAKSEGKTAGLLVQQKDNVFTQSLANIQPGQKVEVIIRYTNSLQFTGSDYEFAFPLAVGSRYGDRTSINSSNSLNPLISPAVASDVAETRSGRDIDVNIEIDAGVAVSGVNSPSHQISVQDANTTKVTLNNKDTIPNRDLILRYKLAGAETQASVLTQSDKQGGYFATYLIPAVDYKSDEIVPKDVVFLMDTSGSQRGTAIAQSKELMRQFISGLNPDDTFNVIDFSDSTTKLAEKPLANTRENRSKALAYVEKIDADGGTELMNGIDTVLDFPAAEDGRLRSIVLLSDGLIGGDESAIARIRDNLKPGNRLYSFGVGNSTNRFLLDRLAELGRGTVTILSPDEDAVEIAEKFFKEINKPVVTNIETEWIGKGAAPEIYPKQSPDLFDRQPLVLYGRKEDASKGKLKITGTVAGGKSYTEILDVDFQQVGGNSAIKQLWGRSRIQDLSNDMYGRENPQGVEAVTQTALDYNLLSKYTSFVAVSEIIPQKNNASVPEPSEIIGNLLALICLVLFFTRKRWYGLGKTMLNKFSS